GRLIGALRRGRDVAARISFEALRRALPGRQLPRAGLLDAAREPTCDGRRDPGAASAQREDALPLRPLRVEVGSGLRDDDELVRRGRAEELVLAIGPDDLD